MGEDKRKPIMLVADDTQPIRVMIADAFKGEFEVYQAENGQEVLDFLEKNDDTAIILLDLWMPVMDGFSVLRRVMRSDNLCKIPVIAMTGSEEISDQLRAYDLGACGVLTKPLNLQIVVHQIRSLLARSLSSYAGERSNLFKFLIEQSEIDSKTGLYNKNRFCVGARKLIDENQGTKFVLFRWDVDGFKVLNDVFGVNEGDRFLVNVGDYYRHHHTDKMVYGRWDADHFVVCMPLEQFMGEHVVDAFPKVFKNFRNDYNVNIRMGVYVIDEPWIDVSLMCDRASLALRSIKGNFTRRVAFYDDSMREEMIENQVIINEMTSALERGEFVIYLQPQFNYSTGSLHGAEALVRWKHPVRGLIPPGKFIPIFERNGFITHVDQYVWDKACALQRHWLDEGHAIVPISVNVSRIDIATLKLTTFFKGLLKKYDLPTNAIRIEITESAYMDTPELLIDTVRSLREAGFNVEIDDFGSGFSSLNTLKDVPVDMLKLDMKFISNGIDDPRSGSILSSVVRMSSWLHLPCLAEGVETKSQADYLKSIGCLYMQGYYFARPMPVEDYEKVLFNEELETPTYAKTDVKDTPEGLEFMNAATRETLIFNSYVGGAAIIEYDGERVDAVRMNDKFFETVNSSEEDYFKNNLHLLDKFDDENRKLFISTLERAIETGEEQMCEMYTEGVMKGMPLYTRARLRKLTKNAGRYLFYLSIENITDKMLLLESVKKLSKKLMTLINTVPGGLCEFTFDREKNIRIDFINDNMAMMFGYSHDEYLKEFADRPLSIIHPDDRESTDRVTADLMAGIITLGVYRFRHICANGAWKWIEMRCAVTKREDGNVSISALTIDISKEVDARARVSHAESKYQQQKMLYKLLLDKIPLSAFIAKYNMGEFTMTDYNKRLVTNLSYPDEATFIKDVESNNGYLRMHPDDAEGAVNAVKNMMTKREGTVLEAPCRLIGYDGKIHNVSCLTTKCVFENKEAYVLCLLSENGLV